MLDEERTVVVLEQNRARGARQLYRHLDFAFEVRLIHTFWEFDYTLTQGLC